MCGTRGSCRTNGFREKGENASFEARLAERSLIWVSLADAGPRRSQSSLLADNPRGPPGEQPLPDPCYR
jgi:hypothetical protein